MRSERLGRFGVLDANFWKTAYLSQPQGEEMKRRRGAFLADLACSSGSAPYVARGLLRNQRVNSTGGQLFADRLHKGKSDPTACPGVNGFTEEDWAELSKLVLN